MIYISHRGNINGKSPEMENNPKYIDRAIELGYDVEVDVWFNNNTWFLGHDEPQYEIEFGWLKKRIDNLWIHCKNLESLVYLNTVGGRLNYFWHQGDDVTLTSRNFMWVYPGKQPVRNSISVLPEIYNDDIEGCMGVCSDKIKLYKEKNECSYLLFGNV